MGRADSQVQSYEIRVHSGNDSFEPAGADGIYCDLVVKEGQQVVVETRRWGRKAWTRARLTLGTANQGQNENQK
ncbi:MAG: hypothetical protein ACOX4Q_12325 [Syntrophomonadales bacterium]